MVSSEAKLFRRKQTGGRGGIRTHGEFNPTLDFESSALNRTQPPFHLMGERFVIELSPAAFAITNRRLSPTAMIDEDRQPPLAPSDTPHKVSSGIK